MERAIQGFRQDDEGQWIAELSCGHHRHVLHHPPFQNRPWVGSIEGRTSALGTPLNCGICDQESGGGDPACWSGLICESCGLLTTDPAHDATCATTTAAR